jgi:N-terminal half of MaoC dehydratase
VVEASGPVIGPEGPPVSINHFPVESGHVLAFARAVGDPNPIYSDEAYARASAVGGLLAPPTFAVAGVHFDPDFALRPPFEATDWPPPNDSGRPELLHAEQHFTYHRTLRVGDVLHASERPGATWSAQGRHGGALSFSEQITEFRDETGALVVTSRTVSVQTERNPRASA